MKRLGETLALSAVATGALLATSCSGEEQPAPSPSHSAAAPETPNTVGPFPANCTSKLGGLVLADKTSKRFRMTLLISSSECGKEYLPPVDVIAYDRTFMSNEEHNVETLPGGSEIEVTCIGAKPPVLGIKADAPAVVMYGLDVPNEIEQAVGRLPDCEPTR